MIKIAYVGLPAHGHSNPALAVLKELVERGHEVVVYNAAAFREKFAPTRAAFRPLPEPMPTEREVAEALHDFINAPLLLSSVAPGLTRFLIDAFTADRPDLVIYDSAAMWGYVAARYLDIPQVCFITTFVLDGSARAIGLGTMARYIWSALPHVPRLLRWRRSMAREFGPENSGGLTEYADQNIVFTSEAFHPPNEFIDERFSFVGPSINPATRDGAFPFEQLVTGPKVYISLGTINHLNAAFYRTAFAAFAGYPAQFILAAGKNTDMATLGDPPANFIVRPYVPQLDILQQVDAFITHGGMNSVHEGLLSGVPEIVIPQHVEQLLNGKQVAATGAGVLLGSGTTDGQVTVAQLRAALDTVLDDPAYREAAERIGATLREAGGYMRAADLVEVELAVQGFSVVKPLRVETGSYRASGS